MSRASRQIFPSASAGVGVHLVWCAEQELRTQKERSDERRNAQTAGLKFLAAPGKLSLALRSTAQRYLGVLPRAPLQGNGRSEEQRP